MRRERQIAAAGEAMQHGREGALPRFVFQNPRHVGIAVARMDHQRQAGFARRRNMLAKALGPARRAGCCRSDNRARPRRSPRLSDASAARSALWRRCPVPHARCADGCRPSRTSPEISQRLPALAEIFARACEIVTMRPMPAARARATTASSSAAKSGKSRWQWLSTSIVSALLRARHSAGTPARAAAV